MDLRGGARSCPRRRAVLIQRNTTHGWPVARAAGAAGIRMRWRVLDRIQDAPIDLDCVALDLESRSRKRGGSR